MYIGNQGCLETLYKQVHLLYKTGFMGLSYFLKDSIAETENFPHEKLKKTIPVY